MYAMYEEEALSGGEVKGWLHVRQTSG